MKTIRKILAIAERILESNLLKYLDKVTNTLYPKPHLKEEDDDEDDDPILFI